MTARPSVFVFVPLYPPGRMNDLPAVGGGPVNCAIQASPFSSVHWCHGQAESSRRVAPHAQRSWRNIVTGRPGVGATAVVAGRSPLMLAGRVRHLDRSVGVTGGKPQQTPLVPGDLAVARWGHASKSVVPSTSRAWRRVRWGVSTPFPTTHRVANGGREVAEPVDPAATSSGCCFRRWPFGGGHTVRAIRTPPNAVGSGAMPVARSPQSGRRQNVRSCCPVLLPQTPQQEQPAPRARPSAVLFCCGFHATRIKTVNASHRMYLQRTTSVQSQLRNPSRACQARLPDVPESSPALHRVCRHRRVLRNVSLRWRYRMRTFARYGAVASRRCRSCATVLAFHGRVRSSPRYPQPPRIARAAVDGRARRPPVNLRVGLAHEHARPERQGGEQQGRCPLHQARHLARGGRGRALPCWSSTTGRSFGTCGRTPARPPSWPPRTARPGCSRLAVGPP